ncbi:Lsr2 family DNA-binding protein [Actinomadura rudentiformis]|uniref:Lsr2 DNA-binding domain-containing protein n=1 Tax=Actinomadura rudentiformis TaxID=359158 RepID=A0A6H9YFB2_9ACTN|nr:Lsr2 family protein [Actinomadura rudentiformis]KAB2344125.1 hypothetical protein F8566_32965 [Actinomadura rudentiformis]
MPAQELSRAHARDWLVNPWYGAVTIDGQGPPSDAVPGRPAQGFTAYQGTKLVIFTGGEDNLRVRVRVESWSSEPPIADDHSEIGPETSELAAPSGLITISDGDASADQFELPSPGTYRARVTGHGQDAAQLYREAVARSTDLNDPQFQAEWAQLHGREEYVIQLWPTADRPQTTEPGQDDHLEAIRAWARSRGLKVNVQGPVPEAIRAMYDASH